MALFRLGIAAAAAYGFYRYMTGRRPVGHAAYASGEGAGGQTDVRNAGPDAMADHPPEWDTVDEASDESFPASDPPAGNHFS